MRKILSVLLLLIPFVAQAQFAESIKYVTVSFQRSANAAAYGANDAVSDSGTAPHLLVFALGRSAGIGGRILSATLEADTANVTNGTFDLILYDDSSSVSAVPDTTTFPLTNARGVKVFNKIAFTLAQYGAGGTSSVAITNGITLPFQPTSGSQNIYGQLVATAAYQGKNGGTFKVKLGYVQE